MKSVLKLPRPTSRTMSGPVITRRGENLTVDYEYQDDDSRVEWVRIIFKEVLVFEYRQQFHCEADDIPDRSDSVTCLSDSPRLAKLQSRRREAELSKPDTLTEFSLYFDDAGCLEVIAGSMSSSLLPSQESQDNSVRSA